MSNVRKLQTIHTFADDVAYAKDSHVSTETTTPKTSLAENPIANTKPATPTTTPTLKTNSSPSRVPVPQPAIASRSAQDFLQNQTEHKKPIPQPTPDADTQTITPSTQPNTPPRKKPTQERQSALKDALANNIGNHTNITPDAELASLDSDTAFETGTIIRDKKQKKFSPLAAISASLTKTFKKLTAQKHVPGPQVTAAELRKDVITSASKQSYNVTENNFRTIKTKPQNNDKSATTTSSKRVQIKDADETSQASWSHFIDKEDNAELHPPESSVPLSPEPEPVPTAVSQTITETPRVAGAIPTDQQSTVTADILDSPKTPASTTAPETKLPTQNLEPTATSIIPPSNTDTTTTSSVTPAKTERTVKKTQVEQTPPVATTSDNHIPSKASSAPQETVATKRFPNTFKAAAQPAISRWFTYVSRFAIVFVIIGAVGLGTSTAYFWFGNFSNESSNRLVSVPSLIPTNQQVAVALGEDRQSLLTRFKENTTRATAITQLYPVYDINASPLVPANPKDIFQIASFRIPGNLERNISSVTFGTTATQAPFLIFRVQDFDTAFAGMLTWEAAMSADLEPWFGATVINTFDPAARTNTQLRPAFFIDRIQDNNNIRVLVDATQTERITYGFVTPQTVLITTTPKMFRSLKNTIKNR